MLEKDAETSSAWHREWSHFGSP